MLSWDAFHGIKWRTLSLTLWWFPITSHERKKEEKYFRDTTVFFSSFSNNSLSSAWRGRMGQEHQGHVPVVFPYIFVCSETWLFTLYFQPRKASQLFDRRRSKSFGSGEKNGISGKKVCLIYVWTKNEIVMPDFF